MSKEIKIERNTKEITGKSIDEVSSQFTPYNEVMEEDKCSTAKRFKELCEKGGFKKNKSKTDIGRDEYEDDTREETSETNVLKKYQTDVIKNNIKKNLSKALLTHEEENALKEKFIQEKTDKVMKNIEDLSKTYEPYENIEKGVEIDEVAMMKMISKLFGKDFKTTEEHCELVKTALEKFHERMENEIQDTAEVNKSQNENEEYVKPLCEVKFEPGEQPPVYTEVTFEDITKDLVELHRNKNNDYGDAAHQSYKEFGITSYVIRLNDKLNRLKVLTKPGAKMKVLDESIIDTLKDLAAYAIMAIESLNTWR